MIPICEVLDVISGHQASVYRTSNSCSAGSRFFKDSNVWADSFVLFKFNFLRLVNAATESYRYPEISAFHRNYVRLRDIKIRFSPVSEIKFQDYYYTYRPMWRCPCRIPVSRRDLRPAISADVRWSSVDRYRQIASPIDSNTSKRAILSAVPRTQTSRMWRPDWDTRDYRGLDRPAKERHRRQSRAQVTSASVDHLFVADKRERSGIRRIEYRTDTMIR